MGECSFFPAFCFVTNDVLIILVYIPFVTWNIIPFYIVDYWSVKSLIFFGLFQKKKKDADFIYVTTQRLVQILSFSK